jgi:hypothetical protein
MEQSSSSEANWFSASQEIPRILWNLKVHYHVNKCPPPVPILSQLVNINGVINIQTVTSTYRQVLFYVSPFYTISL